MYMYVFLFLKLLNSLPASIVCEKPLQNSLEPDQAQQNVGPDLDQSCLTLKDFWDKMLVLTWIKAV